MRVLECLVYEHNLWIVALAALMCVSGSFITTKLFQRTLTERGVSRHLWCFLSAVTAGAAIWATHFIAMLGYNPGAPVSFDATVTISSALIAVAGTGAGLMIATFRNRLIAALCGGGTIGLAIAAMHYVGMFAYRVDGIVRWEPAYVIASLLFVVALGALAIDRLKTTSRNRPAIFAAGLLTAAIVSLHFVGMAAFTVTPLPGVQPGADSEAFISMAAAVALVALLIIGAGVSIHMIELRTDAAGQDRLRHFALHDSLTQLANRHHFTEALKTECGMIDSESDAFALLMIDLDRFKPVNDTLGHPMGDEVLRKVADRLRHAVREDDLVARIGGDEFAVIARNVGDVETASAIARRVVEILSRPFVIDGNVAELGGSVGVALAPQHGQDAEALIHHVDVALYEAKRGGKNRFCLFDPQLTEDMTRRRLMEADIRRACMREDFHVVYQPVIDTATGRFTGAEALVRWTCAERGDVSPAEFIPIAEELGLISRIGAHVLRQACLDAAGWPEHMVLSVNLSPVQLLDPRLPSLVSQALEESGLPPWRLELEITETALLGNDELALSTLEQLRSFGLRISLDDFGTGYSSLSYLHRFPIDRIKIDRSFVQRLPMDPGSASIVCAIAQLGGSLGVMVTAEGIETEEQFEFISKQGCDHVQGFLISKPIVAGEIADLFQAGSNQVAA